MSTVQTSTLFSLSGKVVIVTGGTGILGTAFVHAIAEAGATVIIIGRNEEKAKERALIINDSGGNALGISANVLDEGQLAKAKDQILGIYGKIDGLVNAAGGNTAGGIVTPETNIFELNLTGMREAMELNLWGTILPTQVFGPALAASGNGSIVNISSVSSKRALSRVLGYSMGKAAIDCYTKWFAVEMARRFGDTIRMNSIMPGFFLTEQNRALLTKPDGSLTDRGHLIINQTPFKRFGNPNELVGALVWLLSDASAFVTGMDIGVDGGFTINSGV